MKIWALADLHLSFGVPGKAMDVFGEQWINYAEKIQTRWLQTVQAEDLVLIAGDISWGMRLEEALPDLLWIDRLPGTKVLLRGNHDYWWSSLQKIEKVLPPSLRLIQNNVFRWGPVTICGARLWDAPSYSFEDYICYRENPRAKKSEASPVSPQETEKIFRRELGRLEMSLRCLKASDALRIAMTHYPPIGADLRPSEASALLEEFQVNCCVFGHLHNVKEGALPFGEKNGVVYRLTSCDYLDFAPLLLYTLPA